MEAERRGGGWARGDNEAEGEIEGRQWSRGGEERCAALRCTAVSCSPAGVQLPPVCAVCVLRHATSFCDCVPGGLRRNAGWWRRVGAGSRDPEKSISAEYLMELEPRRFEPGGGG